MGEEKKSRKGVGGRPTKYRQEFCSKLIEWMKKGNSFESFGSEIGVHWDTLYDWAAKKKEFSEAKKIGLAHLLRFDEDMGKAGMSGQLRRLEKELVKEEILVDGQRRETVISREFASATFGQTSWIFKMKNRYPKIYRDRQELRLLNPEGAVSGDDLSEEELESRIEKVLGRLSKAGVKIGKK